MCRAERCWAKGEEGDPVYITGRSGRACRRKGGGKEEEEEKEERQTGTGSELNRMSAFNDFCIVCDQLIPQEALPPRVDKLLYCSEECMARDTSRVPPSAAPGEQSESASSLGDVDSLIASPLLLPMDSVTAMPPGTDRVEENDYMLMELELSSQAVPRTQSSRTETGSTAEGKTVQMLDRVAEDNYKLWLSQHH